MIDEKKRKAIVAMIKRGVAQGDVAAVMRVSQQMVSKIWRAELGLDRGRRGGDRRSARYQGTVKRMLKRKGQ